MLIILLPCFFIFLLSAMLSFYFSRPGNPLYLTSLPNERSLHQSLTPHTGGVAIVISLVLGVLLVHLGFDRFPSFVWHILGTALFVSAISLIDDWRPLPASLRLLVHFIAAGWLLWGADLILPSLLLVNWEWSWPASISYGFVLLFIVWMTNLYNFMDGMDGFAGGMAVIGFGCLAGFGAWHGNLPFMWLNLCVVAACMGFLSANFPPAKIFMGDVGSSLLGFLAAASCLWGARSEIIPLWLSCLIFSPFIVDATVTLLRRILRGEAVWKPHKTHYYQRLVQLGWGHRKTVLWEYVLMLSCALSAFWGAQQAVLWQWLLLGAWLIIYLVLAQQVAQLEESNQN